MTGSANAYEVAASSTGAPLHWESTEIAFTLSLAPAPDTLTVADISAAAAVATAAWHQPLAAYGFALSVAGTSTPAGPHATDSINTIRWAVEPSDPDREPGLLARTFSVYQTSTGVLFDTDIVLNAVDFPWSPDVSTCLEEYDLANALAHELGHALGLAHSMGHPEATMHVTGDACETEKRDLAQDDLDGLAHLYQPVVPPMMETTGCAVAGDTGELGLVVLCALVLVVRRRRRGSRHVALVAAAIACIAPASADAGVLRRLDVAELDVHSTLVVRGRVIATHSVRGRGIETDATIAIDECLAGSCPRTLVVRRRGGELDGVGVFVDGEAQLAANDEVVLFVRVDRDRHARVAGGVQGALHVERTLGVTSLVRDLRGHRLATPTGWRDGEREMFDLASVVHEVTTLRALR